MWDGFSLSSLFESAPASGSPYPVAGRSLRPSVGFARSESQALRHPWLRW